MTNFVGLHLSEESGKPCADNVWPTNLSLAGQ